jgi:hypothetical protein
MGVRVEEGLHGKALSEGTSQEGHRPIRLLPHRRHCGQPEPLGSEEEGPPELLEMGAPSVRLPFVPFPGCDHRQVAFVQMGSIQVRFR